MLEQFFTKLIKFFVSIDDIWETGVHIPQRIDKHVSFSNTVYIGETYSPEQYDRKTTIGPRVYNIDSFNIIFQELNDFKMSMRVHSSSVKNTRFHKML